ncbi:ribosome recycling factor, chloroplast precursor [Actinidia rufa]|uniref:Ribosome-recycling factor, chloroplastic n=1 Tax=Actinidia rufa TaxID=165716 RepID=A0A7J0FJC2_9ERIC|nr:ribosome recycling factor, chloroplast precursor [Actinidia rufa]
MQIRIREDPTARNCGSRFLRVVSCSSAANYVTLRAGTRRTAGKSLAVKRVSERRRVESHSFDVLTGIIRCATIEEIEAQKSLIEKTVKEKMEKTIESVRSNFNSMRTSRANPSILDRVEVEYYGTPVNVKSIAQISTPDASSILVQPFDKSSLKAIEKAIVTSDLGLTPNNDGEVLRLSLPPLTSERRKVLFSFA